MSTDIELRIETLVLDGINGADGALVGDALVQELARLLESAGTSPILAEGRTIDRLDAGTLQARPQAPARFGAGIAQAVHRGLVP
jgi:hypothetical protein